MDNDQIGERLGRLDVPETILVVEDSETVRGLVCEILTRAGYGILSADGPEEALSTCEVCGHAIDLLVTDIMMPGMTGLELSSRLSERFPRMRVLFISGYTGETVLEEGMLDERSAFLQKPFSPDALVSAVRSVLDE
ncbi:MAG TPA: response regulator [Candidatus Deferrimicrobiaceae bacterium]|jgi:CheY-like chemotaxis protein